ncbi:hypothetical protein E6H23_06960 [Candidatus Bathyarchaeota archaeon]|nr:MAG: hypothetical protein E6H23_06960 [Candidatus Bathyarchaeota archaeon]
MYPFLVVRDSVEHSGKTLHTVLVKIVPASDSEVGYYFYEYRFVNPPTANFVELMKSLRVDLVVGPEIDSKL